MAKRLPPSVIPRAKMPMVAARIPRELLNTLRLAATQQRNAGRKPASVNAIIEHSLREWLTRNGFGVK
jgi:hypothetical protein